MAKLSDMKIEMEYNQGYSPVDPLDFYRDLFGDGFLEGEIGTYRPFPEDPQMVLRVPYEPKSDASHGIYYPTAIAYERVPYDTPRVTVTKSGKKLEQTHYVRHCHITNELTKLNELLNSKNFTFMRPIGFIGPRGTQKNARWLFALAVEIDKPKVIGGYIQEGLRYLLEHLKEDPPFSEKGHTLYAPRPTYLVLSGSGVHLYYIFERPLPMYKNIVDALTKYKENLTTMLWDRQITDQWEQIEYEPIWQPFRLVGGVTKNGGRTRAYKIGEKVSVEYLNKWAREFKAEIPETKQSTSTMSLLEAAQKYPNWYQERIIEGKERGYYTLNRAVYDRWKEMMIDQAKDGTRYWCLVALTAYAVKCGIDWEELEDDALGMLEYLESLTVKEDNHFSADDIISATAMHNEPRMHMFPKAKLERLTQIKWPEAKRNGRKQAEHLRRERILYNADHPGWQKENPGRPSKEQIVRAWRKEHPDGSRNACVRETGLSKPTVYKWWDEN